MESNQNSQHCFYSNQLEKANNLKTKANLAFQKQEYLEAEQLYKEILFQIDPSTLINCTNSIVQQYVALNLVVMNNLSLVYIKLQKYDLAIQFADQVLLVDKDNVKSYHRKAQAYYDKNQIEQAYQAIKSAYTIAQSTQPENVGPLVELYNTIKTKYIEEQQEIKKAQKEIYSRMFNSQSKQAQTLQNSEVISTKEKVKVNRIEALRGIIERIFNSKPFQWLSKLIFGLFYGEIINFLFLQYSVKNQKMKSILFGLAHSGLQLSALRIKPPHKKLFYSSITVAILSFHVYARQKYQI